MSSSCLGPLGLSQLRLPGLHVVLVEFGNSLQLQQPICFKQLVGHDFHLSAETVAFLGESGGHEGVALKVLTCVGR